MSTFLFLDSRDSIDKSIPSEYTWLLSGMNSMSTNNITLAIDTFILPFSRYVIHSYNKYIYIKQNGGATQIAVLTEGNYTATTLCSEIKTRLDALGVLVYTVTYNSTTQKITISVPIPDVFQLVSGSYNPYKVLGVDTDVFTTAVSTYTTPYQVDLSGTKYIDISCTSIPIQNSKSGDSYPILMRIPCYTQIGSVLSWENYNSDKVIKVAPYQLDQLSIRLIDDEGNPYNLDKTHELSLTIRLTPISQ